MRRSSILGIIGIAVGALTLSACAAGTTGGDTGSTGGSGDAKSYKIGIAQFVQHPALDAASEGFQQAFKDAGIDATFDIQNANAEQATSATIATKFASDDTDLVLAIATPVAQAAAQAITTKPVLFTAVTDAVSAGLVKTNDKPGGNVTGTSDMNPVADQIDLLHEIVPDAKSIGIVYSSGEVNSEIQVEAARKQAKELGLEVKEATITAAADLQTALDSLGAVDSLYIPTDNLVTSGMGAVIGFAEAKKIPVIGAESNQVVEGAIATLGLDYTKLGYQTGQMAIRILTEGADPATMPVETQTEFLLTVNPKAAEAQGITIPAAVLERADDTIK